MGVLASIKILSLFVYGWEICLHSVGNGGVSFLKCELGGLEGAGLFFGGIFFRLLFYYDLFFVDFGFFFSFGEVPLFLVFIGSHSLFLCF